MNQAFAAALAGLGLVVLLAAGPARADQSWVQGQVRLNLRTGPGTQYRILGVIQTGDPVTVVSHADDWTEVRTPDGKDGWIPAGFLATDPPATLRLANAESELQGLRQKVDTLSQATSKLSQENQSLSTRTETQAKELRKLRSENLDLRAGQRWPYLVTGASILTAGMILGAILHRLSGRRSPPRIRI